MKTFLYIRGNPGTGKITIARQLQNKLGWKLFWFHDLKNAVFNIVQEHRIPRLMDELTVPVAKFLLAKGENVIYVRPSPDKETVENIRNTVAEYPEYKFAVVRLVADYDILHDRVTRREDPYRITTKEALDEYLGGRQVADVEGEIIIDTSKLKPEDVAEYLMKALGLRKE